MVSAKAKQTLHVIATSVGVYLSASQKMMGAFSLPYPFTTATATKLSVVAVAEADAFPSFLPKEIQRIKDPIARNLAMRIQRLPVSVSAPSSFTYFIAVCVCLFVSLSLSLSSSSFFVCRCHFYFCYGQ